MEDERFYPYNLQVYIKRDDLIHSIITGNKWRKLREYLLIAQKENINTIISFGGAFSNHIYALAYACKELKINLHLIIRGDELSINSNPYLSQIHQWGANLYFISRQDYKEKHIPFDYDSASTLVIPEGGFSPIGVSSMAELSKEIDEDYHHILVSVGTGTTLIGLAMHLPNSLIHGILSLSNKNEIEENCKLFNKQFENILLHDQFIEKKYGKKNTELEKFCIDFFLKYNIPIEPIYTGLLFHSFFELVKQNVFANNSKILLIHTGGIK